MPTSRLASFGGWFIIAIAVMFGAGTLYSTYTISKFHNRIEHLESEGELVSLDELIYKVETETDDAIYYLDKIVHFHQTTISCLRSENYICSLF